MNLTAEERIKVERTRKYLGQIRGARRRVAKLEEELDKLRSGGIGGIKLDDVRVQTSGHGGLDLKVIRVMEYEELLDCEKTTILTIKNKIVREITLVYDYEQRNLLSDRYVHEKKWEAIMESIHVDRSTVFRIHNRALIAFYDINQAAVEEFMTFYPCCD